MLDGLTSGIKRGISSAINAVKNGLSQIRSFFPFSPAKRGPFSGSGYTTYSGRALMGDFAKSISSQRGVVAAATEGAMSAARGGFDASGTSFGGRGGDAAVCGGALEAIVALLREIADKDGDVYIDGRKVLFCALQTDGFVRCREGDLMRARQRFAYNGYDLTAHVAVTSVSRSILPSRRLNRQELPGADGELAVASGLDSLEIKVACSLKASTLEEVSSRRRMLSAELLSGGAAQLILPDEPHLWLVAIYEGGAELSRNANMPSMELTFLVPDPVAYGEERRVSIDGSGSISVGGTAPDVTGGQGVRSIRVSSGPLRTHRPASWSRYQVPSPVERRSSSTWGCAGARSTARTGP